MKLKYQKNGNLIKGVYPLTFEEFFKEFGFNKHRETLIQGLELALSDLKECGCKKVYIDGSFVSKKELPNDFDACWDESSVNLSLLKTKHPIFFNFDNKRLVQRIKYKGELFPMTLIASNSPIESYIDFFQHDKFNISKGIILINL